jgi:hypothetical protein
VEAKMKEIIQETELLTQEFNPKQDDFEEDVCQENQELALVSVDKGMFYL